jgi:hypothetical protein
MPPTAAPTGLLPSLLVPEPLPGRAAAAREARAARRLEVLWRARRLAAEDYAAGLSADPPPAVVPPSFAEFHDLFAAQLADQRTLAALNLGEPGTPGGPVRWDDPRLGPLWPDGPPAWYAAAEVACRERGAELTSPPADEAAGDWLTDDVLTQIAGVEWLKREEEAGRLRPYRGQYVVAANHTILGHDPALLQARRAAAAAAARAGIPEGHLADYFVSSP